MSNTNKFIVYVSIGCGKTTSVSRAREQQFPPVLLKFWIEHPDIPLIRVLIDPGMAEPPVSAQGYDMLWQERKYPITTYNDQNSFVINVKSRVHWSSGADTSKDPSIHIIPELTKMGSWCESTNSLLIIESFMGNSLYRPRHRIHKHVSPTSTLVGLSWNSANCMPKLDTDKYFPQIFVEDSVYVINPDGFEKDPERFNKLLVTNIKKKDNVLHERMKDIFESVKEDFIDLILSFYRMIIINTYHKGINDGVLKRMKLDCNNMYMTHFSYDDVSVFQKVKEEEVELYKYIHGMKKIPSIIDHDTFKLDPYGEFEKVSNFFKSLNLSIGTSVGKN
jgi:hypothetical protein